MKEERCETDRRKKVCYIFGIVARCLKSMAFVSR